METGTPIRIGTCSWKYCSRVGLVYSRQEGRNLLAQYSRRYATVKVDRWLWSLFTSDTPVLPQADVVRGYTESVPPYFIFSIKATNCISLPSL